MWFVLNDNKTFFFLLFSCFTERWSNHSFLSAKKIIMNNNKKCLTLITLRFVRLILIVFGVSGDSNLHNNKRGSQKYHLLWQRHKR